MHPNYSPETNNLLITINSHNIKITSLFIGLQIVLLRPLQVQPRYAEDFLREWEGRPMNGSPLFLILQPLCLT